MDSNCEFTHTVYTQATMEDKDDLEDLDDSQGEDKYDNDNEYEYGLEYEKDELANADTNESNVEHKDSDSGLCSRDDNGTLDGNSYEGEGKSIALSCHVGFLTVDAVEWEENDKVVEVMCPISSHLESMT